MRGCVAKSSRHIMSVMFFCGVMIVSRLKEHMIRIVISRINNRFRGGISSNDNPILSKPVPAPGNCCWTESHFKALDTNKFPPLRRFFAWWKQDIPLISTTSISFEIIFIIKVNSTVPAPRRLYVYVTSHMQRIAKSIIITIRTQNIAFFFIAI